MTLILKRKKTSKIVTEKNGGEGAVREIIDNILKNI